MKSNDEGHNCKDENKSCTRGDSVKQLLLRRNRVAAYNYRIKKSVKINILAVKQQ